MKRLIIPFITIVFFLFNTPSFSSESSGKYYMGLGLGQSSVTIDGNPDQEENTDTAFKVFFGLNLYSHLAIECGYISHGEFSAHWSYNDETDIRDSNALFAAIKGAYNFTDQLSMFGKLGAHLWREDVEGDATYMGVNCKGLGDGSGLGILFGLGVEFDLSDLISVGVEWEAYKNVGDGVEFKITGTGISGKGELDGHDVSVISAFCAYNF